MMYMFEFCKIHDVVFRRRIVVSRHVFNSQHRGQSRACDDVHVLIGKIYVVVLRCRIVVSISASHAEELGSLPRVGIIAEGVLGIPDCSQCT